MVELIIVDSSQKVLRFPMLKEEAVIGRCEDCDIQIDDPMISRYHAKVSVAYFIQDIGSTNGIWKEGKRFKKTTIAPGEEICLGKKELYQLRLEAGPALKEPSPAMKEPPLEKAVEPAREAAGKDPGKGSTAEHGRMDQMKAQLEKLKAQVEPLKALEAQVAPLKAQLEQMKAQVAPMKADLERSNAARLQLEKANKDMMEENRFLRAALYPDGAPPGLEEPGEAIPEATEAPEVPSAPETVTEPVVEDESVMVEEPVDVASVPEPVSDVPPVMEEPAEDRVDYGIDTLADEAFLRQLMDIYISDTDLDIPVKESTREDLLFILKALQNWGRDVERVTTRVAQEYAGISGPIVTMLPEVEHNVTSLVVDFLSKGGSARAKQLEQYLVRLRTWYVACLGGYRKALEKWCRDFLARLAPSTIRNRKKYNFLVRGLGLDEIFYWKLFEETMRNINVPTLIEEFEEHAAEAAMEIANKDQMDPLGKGSQIF